MSNYTCPLCRLQYADRSLLELHIREDHAQRDETAAAPAPPAPDPAPAPPPASSSAAPVNSLSTSAPFSSFRHATYSLATRFMPSRSGVTSITSAARYSAAISSRG